MSRCVCVRPPSNRPFLDVSSFIQPTVCISGRSVSRCVSVRPPSNRPFLDVSSFIQPTVCISGLCVCLDVSLSSDFIAGFCGETEDDHEMTLNLIRRVKYNFVFCFPYSMRQVQLLGPEMACRISVEVEVGRLVMFTVSVCVDFVSNATSYLDVILRGNYTMMWISFDKMSTAYLTLSR